MKLDPLKISDLSKASDFIQMKLYPIGTLLIDISGKSPPTLPTKLCELNLWDDCPRCRSP